MRILIVLFVLLSSLRTLGQDPSCEYSITLQDVDINKYSYKFFTETDYDKIATDSIISYLKKGKNIGREHTESTLSKATKGKSLITTYYSDYCYPNSSIKNQLRIIISRENKKTRKIEFMFTSCPLTAGKADIMVEKFQKGERECAIYNPTEIYNDNKYIDYGWEQKREFSTIKIYIY
jgi:hypothetical protein